MNCNVYSDLKLYLPHNFLTAVITQHENARSCKSDGIFSQLFARGCIAVFKLVIEYND